MVTYWILLILISFAAGVMHTLAGFGNGLVMMMVFPYLMPIAEAAAVNCIVGGVLSGTLLWRYRKSLRPRFVLLTLIPYLISSIVMLHFVKDIGTRTMALLFGAFLTILGIYYLTFSEKARMPINPFTLVVCPVASGLSSAMFGIGGPLMSLLYLEKFKTREEYTVSLQLLFFVAAVVNTVTRAANGIITASVIPTVLVGTAAVLAGEQVGIHLAGRMKPETLRKFVFIMILVSGIVMIVNNR